MTNTLLEKVFKIEERKSSIKTDGNKGKIIAIIQPLLEIYDALSDTKPEQGTLERIKAVWPDIREKTPYSSGADIYFGESIVKDDSKYMRKIKKAQSKRFQIY